MPTLIHERPVVDQRVVLPGRVARSSLPHRFALRLGLWLLIRSTRAQAPPRAGIRDADAEIRRLRAASHLERASRELDWQLRHLRLPLS